jgi:phosphoenolpyruvate carboxykinase (ATP)
MCSMLAGSDLGLNADRLFRNLSMPQLVELALKRGEGKLGANGTLMVSTGDRTGRSPADKYLEDTPEIHDNIDWGKINQPISTQAFDELERIAAEHMASRDSIFVFDGYVGADPAYRLKVSTFCELAWHALFVQTLFIEPAKEELKGFDADWTVINCCTRKLTAEESERLGLNKTAAGGKEYSGVCIVQSMTRKKVIIFGTQYAGEMKKSLFYAMNHDMPDQGVFPMHCSANVANDDPENVALFFGLSGTGKTTLSADPNRALIGDDEHGWSDRGVFNFEGGCYAKCIHLTEEGEPQIWNAIRFGSVLENVVYDEHTRVADYDDGSITENTRVTYPVEFIPGAKIPSVGLHPKNVIFLTADAFGVLPPVAHLTPEQAMYYFINGYTSKLAGTEDGVKEPTPNFSPCFGGPFMPRPPRVYANQLVERVKKHGANVWLINTGWSGGAYGVGKRMKLAYTRAMISAILNGSLAKVAYETEQYFGLQIPKEIPGGMVPAEVLNPKSVWSDPNAYDAQARALAKRFRDNDARFDMPQAVRDAGPRG